MRFTSILFAIACGASCAVACGGSKTSSGNNGNGDDASTGTSSGSGSSSGSSSSSGAGDDATTGDDAGPTCMDSSSCPGQVCCASISIGGAMGFGFTEACAASCTGMAVQLCSTDAECMTGTCTPSPLGMGSYCAPEGGFGGFTMPDGGFTRPDGGFTRPDGGNVPEGGGPSDGAVE